MKKKYFVRTTGLWGLVDANHRFAKNDPLVTISVRNRTGSELNVNFKSSQGAVLWLTIPNGVSTITLPHGFSDYWADSACGHLAGHINVDTPNKTLWLSCDQSALKISLLPNDPSRKAKPCEAGYYEPNPSMNVFYPELNWGGTMEEYYYYRDLSISYSIGIIGCFEDLPTDLPRYYCTYWEVCTVY